MADTELMASMRDASFLRCPGRAGKYHAIIKHKDGHRGPACSPGMQHIHDLEEPAAGLLESEKCQAPGCRKAFAQLAKDPQP